MERPSQTMRMTTTQTTWTRTAWSTTTLWALLLLLQKLQSENGWPRPWTLDRGQASNAKLLPDCGHGGRRTVAILSVDGISFAESCLNWKHSWLAPASTERQRCKDRCAAWIASALQQLFIAKYKWLAHALVKLAEA